MTEPGGAEPALTLERFLRILPALEVPQLLAISAAHAHGRGEALEQARDHAAVAARTSGLLDELRELQATIVQWIGADLAPSRRYTGEGLVDSRILGEVREQARPALLDAATALLLADSLAPDDRAALLEPVDSVIG